MSWAPGGGPAPSAYLEHTLRRAADIALRLHADAVSTEHLLLALLADEECGAHRLIVHAFADPPTLYAEVLALAPGILVVGSERSLPFSARGVRALYAAHSAAAARGAERVEPADVVAAAVARLGPGARDALEGAGLDAGRLRPVPAEAGRPQQSPFARFDMPAKRALGRAARTAAELGREAVAPAHLVLGVLAGEPELAASLGLSPSRARMALAGKDEDPEALPDRPLTADAELEAFLRRLPAGAGTAETLAGAVREGGTELRLLLVQQRITDELMQRSAGAFDDPAPPAGRAGSDRGASRPPGGLDAPGAVD